MKILKVGVDRFVQEVRRHVQMDEKREVNWFRDEDNLVHLYAFTNYSYAYVTVVDGGSIPDSLKVLIKDVGNFLGFEDEESPVLADVQAGIAGLKRDNSILFQDRLNLNNGLK